MHYYTRGLDPVLLKDITTPAKSLVYLVDLEANGGKGSCTCPDFKFNIKNKYKKGLHVQPCKHILYVLGYLVWNKLNKN